MAIFSPRVSFLYLTPFLAISSTIAASVPKGTNTVNLRIEGDNSTYYEGPITSGPCNITLPSFDGYGTFPRPCNGLNEKANPSAGNTPTCALDAAARAKGFTYDGGYDTDIDDFSITTISTPDDSPNKYWGYLVNYQISTFPEHLYLSGCQQEVKAGDEVLWAFITDPPGPADTGLFLKLAPTAVTVKKGKGFTVTVTDGMSGAAVQNASVDGVHTDASGKATLYLFDTGFFQFKAHLTGSVRSNVMNVTVTS